MSNDPNYTPVDVTPTREQLQDMIAEGVRNHVAANPDPRIDVAGYPGTAGGQEIPSPRLPDAPFNPNVDGTLGTAPAGQTLAGTQRGLTTGDVTLDVLTTHGATEAVGSVPGSSEGPNQPGKSDIQAASDEETGGKPASDAAPRGRGK